MAKKIEPQNAQIERFPEKEVRFVKTIITKTLNSDSPGISEMWLVPSKFSELDINSTEAYLESPFAYILDQGAYLDTLSNLGYVGKVKFFWKNN